MRKKTINKNIYSPQFKIEYPFLADDENNKKSFDLLFTAFSVFKLEKELRKSSIDISLLRLTNKKIEKSIVNDLTDIVAFTLLEYVLFKISHLNLKIKKPKNQKKIEKRDAICLFSGGVDSYSGILNTKEHIENTEGIFIAHSDQTKIINIVQKLKESIMKQHNIPIFKQKAPSLGKGGYSQTRGFLYILSAAAHINMVGANKLIITECGPTMYQPQFGPADDVTLTANPMVLEISAKVISKILKKKINIITPFEDLTKAEVMSISPEKEGLRQTHSCITQRFGTHCGTCYGCIVRRLAGIASNIHDVEYTKDPLQDDNANSDNLISLLVFSQDVLLSFDEMPYYQRKNIDVYDKEDLFKRFALDNYAAIHKLINKKVKVTKDVETLYIDTVEEIGTNILEKRLNVLEKGIFSPNYIY